MNRCKNCGTEEQGHATLLDKRGYCYKPYCQSRSYDEVEQQNSRLQFELDRQIKVNRKLVGALKKYILPENYEGGMGREYENVCIECKEILKEIGEL